MHGEAMLRNFVLDICGCRGDWTMERYLEEQVEAIRRRSGPRTVFLLASGGVDSTVCARLLGEALGPEQLHLLHVDNGLMRKDESRAGPRGTRRGSASAATCTSSTRPIGSSPRSTASIEPERKRRIIGDTFIRVFEDEMRRLDLGDMLLAQGTIYPDTIETGGTKRADTIKTHHNRVPDHRGDDPGRTRRSNRFASCTRSKSARWPRRWASPRRSCGGIRSRARASACACCAPTGGAGRPRSGAHAAADRRGTAGAPG